MYLRQGNMAENTINAYLYAIREYYSRHRELNKRNLLIYKTYLIETFKPKTVNLRIQAMNKYLECIKKPRLRLKSVKVQQRSYLENVISNADYIFLKNKLKREDNLTWYFVVRFLAATGARVSELIQIKIEHVQIGYYDIYTKGGKIRRIYIPKTLRKETAEWLIKTNRTSGYLFLNRFGERITTRGIAQQLKNYAVKYGLNEKVVYPHSFRSKILPHRILIYGAISVYCSIAFFTES
ncbi:MAG: tyrosine-type recombinase/integrase [Clostridium sp.]|nr:tyrosine-type recombinase/integrase [Clostridium sp.]